MIRQRKALLSTIAMVFVAVAAFAASAADAAADNSKVVGTWNIEAMYKGEMMKITLKLEEKDGKLAGTWIGPHRTNELSDVAWDGTALTFVRNVDHEGKQVGIHYKATVSGDDMKGTILQPGEGEYPFTAKRQHADH